MFFCLLCHLRSHIEVYLLKSKTIQCAVHEQIQLKQYLLVDVLRYIDHFILDHVPLENYRAQHLMNIKLCDLNKLKPVSVGLRHTDY